MNALVGRGYIPTFEACKRDGTAAFPGPACWTPRQHKDDEPQYLGIGYNCTRTGQQCSAKTCPECTANAAGQTPAAQEKPHE